MFKTLFLKKVIQWIAGIDWPRFLQIVQVVKDAAALYPKRINITAEEEKQVNINRALFVSTEISKMIGFGNTGANIITVIRELAVWYSRRAK